MRLGFNFTLESALEMVQRMIKEGHIDYCELLMTPPTKASSGPRHCATSP